MKVLVTGATGFVGSRLIELLKLNKNYKPVAAIRKQNAQLLKDIQMVMVDDLGPTTQWQNTFHNTQVVIHTAARVHIMNDTVDNPLAEFRRVNLEGALNLARQAAIAGVKRFIFISSIKVNGESTCVNQSYKAEDIPAPIDPYGVSKHETEIGLRHLAAETGMEVVIIRPPLVYGPGVKANFLSMMRWLNKGIPLPFGAIYNKRSLVALDNLVDLIVTCLEHPTAANQIFLVSDGVDLSTTVLLRRVAGALGKPSRLLPVPQKLLEGCLKMTGKSDLARRLCGSLQVDISKTRSLLDWNPPVSVDEALRKAAEDFLAREQCDQS